VIAGRDQFLAVLLADLQHGEVGLGIAADQPGIEVAAVAEGDLDLVSAFDDVEVRENIAVRADNDAGTEPGGFRLIALGTVAEEVTEDRVVKQGIAARLDLLRGKDMHHRRQRLFCRLAKGRGRDERRRHRRRLLHRDDAGAGRWPLAQPLRLECADHEENGKTNRHRLCKNQPEPAHGQKTGASE
jgi:hypothetical protein